METTQTVKTTTPLADKEKQPDIIIIGNPVAGRSVKWAADEAGLTSVIIDGRLDHPGSPAAIGLIRETWMHSKPQKFRCGRSVGIYAKRGLLINTNVQADSLAKRGVFTDLDGAYVVDVERAMGPADIEAIVTAINGRTVLYEAADGQTGGTLTARLGIFVCAAHKSNLLTARPIEKVTFGATMYSDQENAGQPVSPFAQVRRVRPYVDITVCSNGRSVWAGSSTGDSPESAKANAIDLLAAVKVRLRGWWLIGTRAPAPGDIQESFAPYWTTGHKPDQIKAGAGEGVKIENHAGEIAPVCTLAGFGKFGYSLAPAVAEEAIARLRALYTPDRVTMTAGGQTTELPGVRIEVKPRVYGRAGI